MFFRRPRSNSLRVGNITDDILMRRSSSLRQGLGIGIRRPSSHEELGIPSSSSNVPTIQRPVRLTLNGGIGKLVLFSIC